MILFCTTAVTFEFGITVRCGTDASFIAWWLQRHNGTREGYWLEEVRDTYRSRPTVTYRLHDGSEEFASFGPRVGNGPSANDNFQTTTSFEVGCMTA